MTADPMAVQMWRWVCCVLWPPDFKVEVQDLDLDDPNASHGYPSNEEIRTNLGGHDLACWCPLDQPCHADVLLEVANG